MLFRKAKNAPLNYDPVVPKGWSVQVRVQHQSHANMWEYRIWSPARINDMYPSSVNVRSGSGYSTRQEAIRAAVDHAEYVERSYINDTQEWETV